MGVMTVALIVVGYLAGSLLLAVGVGRFIRAGHRPTPPTPPYRVGDPTTYRKTGG
jgi:hypothetical protein